MPDNTEKIIVSLDSDMLHLVIPEMVTISASAERTINPSNYIDGHGYESFKTSAFRSRQVSANLSLEQQDAISSELNTIVRTEVDVRADAYITELKAPKEDAMNAEELGQVAPLVKMILGEMSMDELATHISEAKLNDRQLVFLRELTKVIRTK